MEKLRITFFSDEREVVSFSPLDRLNYSLMRHDESKASNNLLQIRNSRSLENFVTANFHYNEPLLIITCSYLFIPIWHDPLASEMIITQWILPVSLFQFSRRPLVWTIRCMDRWTEPSEWIFLFIILVVALEDHVLHGFGLHTASHERIVLALVGVFPLSPNSEHYRST